LGAHHEMVATGKKSEGGFLVAVSAARARIQEKAHMRAHKRSIKWEIREFEERIENNDLDEKTKAELRKALATIKELTNMEATE
jgi:hypothetical protein